MFVIRRAQHEALAQPVVETFLVRLAAFTRAAFPDQTSAMTDDALRRYLRERIAEAVAYRITLQRDVCRYVELALLYGPASPGNPAAAWALEILGDVNLDGTTKMDRVDEAEARMLARRHGDAPP